MFMDRSVMPKGKFRDAMQSTKWCCLYFVCIGETTVELHCSRLSKSQKRRTPLIPSSNQILSVTAPGILQIFNHNHHLLSTWDTGLGILYSVSWCKLVCMKIPWGRYFYSNFTAKECAAQSNFGALNKCHVFPFRTVVTTSCLLCSRVHRHTGAFHCLRITDARIRTNLSWSPFQRANTF